MGNRGHDHPPAQAEVAINDPTHFGNRLRYARMKKGLSQRELGGEKFSASYISRIESGARPPTQAVLEELSRVLEIPAGIR